RQPEDLGHGRAAEGTQGRPAPAAGHRGRDRERVPVGPQPAVRAGPGRAGPGPGRPGRRRLGGDHLRRRQEDRGVAGMNDAKLYAVIRAPRVSEKTARLQEVSNQYVFEVATDATKADIKVAVEKLFEIGRASCRERV